MKHLSVVLTLIILNPSSKFEKSSCQEKQKEKSITFCWENKRDLIMTLFYLKNKQWEA
jgi:hypothetical protein